MCAVLVTSCQKQEKTNNHMIVVYLLVYGINGLGAITLVLFTFNLVAFEIAIYFKV